MRLTAYGQIDLVDATNDVNRNGVLDLYDATEASRPDLDGDGTDDFLDVDDDGDGVDTEFELGSLASPTNTDGADLATSISSTGRVSSNESIASDER